MTKVYIIDVDLGASVKDIILDDVETVTGEAKKLLEDSIAEQKATQRVKDQKTAAKQQKDDAIEKVMLAAYSSLEEAGTDGVSADIIVEGVQPTVPNSSAFTLRMKKILREKGNPYALKRRQRGGKPVYIFEPFNQETED